MQSCLLGGDGSCRALGQPRPAKDLAVAARAGIGRQVGHRSEGWGNAHEPAERRRDGQRIEGDAGCNFEGFMDEINLSQVRIDFRIDVDEGLKAQAKQARSRRKTWQDLQDEVAELMYDAQWDTSGNAQVESALLND